MDKKKPATKKATPATKKAAPKKKDKKAENIKQEPPKKNGRPEVYTQELADKVCEAIATSQQSLRTICEQENMPSVATILKWLREDKNGFVAQYARAKEEQVDLLVEDMIDISEHTHEDHTPFTGGNVIQRDKLRIETRKWLASKLKAKKYGDKLDITTGGEKIKTEPTVIKWGDKEIKV